MENQKTTDVAVKEIQFLRKWCVFQQSMSKTGRRSILAAKSVFFQEKGKTHHNITILTMCKIYNINNNKTADI